ncbi:MAG: YARHG domain-containing protein [Oligoflexia bacterium]|nr:YARHG domain-containing protein [Oligoflexia bacterium]
MSLFFWLILVWSAQAQIASPACQGTPQQWLETLTQGANRDAYLCLAGSDEAAAMLLQAASATDPAAAGADANVAHRLTRALALHIILRLDRPVSAQQSRALNSADRRLVSDAIRARRGRRTPSADHAAVFEQFEWYQPDDHYNNGQLTKLDRANIAMIDHPPTPPTPQKTASAADGVAQGARSGQLPRGACGCMAGPGMSTLSRGLLGLLVCLALVRRRERSVLP